MHVLYPGEPRPVDVGLAGLSEASARAYLSMLVTDLLTSHHAYYAPAGPLLEELHQWGARSPDAWHAAVVKARYGAFGRAYGSVPHSEEYPVPSIDELHAMYARRYGLYAELRGGVAA